MDWLWYILLFLFVLCGVALNILTLPGNWLMLLAGMIYGLATRGRYLGWWWVLAILVGAAIGEIVEFAAGGRAAKNAGGSRWGGWGAIVGGVIGGIGLSGLLPIIFPLSTVAGILIGTFLGAALGELIGGKPMSSSVVIGLGATKGRLVGTLLKVAIGGLIAIVMLIAALPVWS